MTETQIKNLIHTFQEKKAQVELLRECADIYDNENVRQQYEKKYFQIKVLTDMLSILSDEEKFVIETHLMRHHTWIETVKLFSEKYGKANEKSERTLKRIQSRALKKMINFIKHLPIQDCFIE